MAVQVSNVRMGHEQRHEFVTVAKKNGGKRPKTEGVGGGLRPRGFHTPLSPSNSPPNTPTTIPCGTIPSMLGANNNTTAITRPAPLAHSTAIPGVLDRGRGFCLQFLTSVGVPA